MQIRNLVSICTLLVLWCLPVSASAQAAADSAVAQALFDEGRQLMQAGNHQDACPKLAESQRLDPGAGTQFWLADCYEQTGKYASAWTLFLEVAAASKKAGESVREQIARERAESVKEKVQYLTLTYQGDPPEGLEVTKDEGLVGLAQLGLALPTDAGEHIVRVSAPGKKTIEFRFILGQSENQKLVTLPALEDEDEVALSAPASPPEEATPPVASPMPSPATTQATQAVPPPQRRKNSLRIAGLSAAGGGAVAMGVGGLLGLMAKSKANQADCDSDNICTPEGLVDRKGAVNQANVATVFAVAGGALLATGITLFVLSTNKGHSEVAVGARGNGVSLRGRW